MDITVVKEFNVFNLEVLKEGDCYTVLRKREVTKQIDPNIQEGEYWVKEFSGVLVCADYNEITFAVRSELPRYECDDISDYIETRTIHVDNVNQDNIRIIPLKR